MPQKVYEGVSQEEKPKKIIVPTTLPLYLEEQEGPLFEKLAADPEFVFNPETRELSWEGEEEDLENFSGIAEFLNQEDMDDGEFGVMVRPLITSKLKESLFFSRLDSLEGVPGVYSNTPLEHISQQLEKLFTDAKDLKKFRVMLRHFSFFHDLGKRLDPADPAHGSVSALIARKFYQHENQQAFDNGAEQPLYSEEFIETVAYLCQVHHLFKELGRLLDEKLQLMIAFYLTIIDERLALSGEGRYDEAEEKKNAMSRAFMAFAAHFEDYPVLDYDQFNEAFGDLVGNEDILLMLYVFTVADIEASEKFAHFVIQNTEIIKHLVKSVSIGELFTVN